MCEGTFALWFEHVCALVFKQKDAKLRSAWSGTKPRIKPVGKLLWNRVNGLMSNVIATIYSIGSKKSHYHVWIDKEGNSWSFLPGLSTLPVNIAVQDDVISDVWFKAAGSSAQKW